MHHIYTTTRNHKYLLVYKSVNACMFTKTRYLSSCINIHTPKTTALIIVLINTNSKQGSCACIHGYHTSKNFTGDILSNVSGRANSSSNMRSSICNYINTNTSKQQLSILQMFLFNDKPGLRSIREITKRWSKRWSHHTCKWEICPQALASSAYQVWITLLGNFTNQGHCRQGI